jgi:hypothetical protein
VDSRPIPSFSKLLTFGTRTSLPGLSGKLILAWADSKKHRETNGRAPRGGRSPLSAVLRRTVSRFAREIRQDHGLLDRPTAERLSRLLKAALTARNKPGRKATPEVLRAVELRRSGTPWPKIYSAVIPNFWSLSYPDRFWRSRKLRDAVSAHFRRRRQTASAKRPSEKKC